MIEAELLDKQTFRYAWLGGAGLAIVVLGLRLEGVLELPLAILGGGVTIYFWSKYVVRRSRQQRAAHDRKQP